MGLDMYLTKRNAAARDEQDEMVAYWRKANHIHGGTVKNLAHFSDSLISPPSGAATPPAESRPDSASSPTRSRPRT